MNVITEWRQAVQTQLETSLQGGAYAGVVVAGECDGAQHRKLACVFAPTFETDGGNVSFARPTLIVRAWVPKPKTPSSTVPVDPEPVEQLMIDLAACLQGIQTPSLASAKDGLYAFVTRIRPDYEDWGVEATLQAWTGNPATSGG